ncbi:MAG: putative rane protein [Pseudonocardiales bacterium]|nr:putative rane protein [Pseudonocardiales bacterium]
MRERFRHGRLRIFGAVTAAALMTTGVGLASAAPSASAVDGPAITVTPATGLAAAGAEITVSGSGFSTAGNGIYVGIAGTATYSPTNPGVFGAVKWVHTGATPSPGQDVLDNDGTFSTTLNVAATFGTTDCLASACAIYTLASQGSSDRSQDTSAAVTFADGETTSPTPTETTASPTPTETTASPTPTETTTSTPTATPTETALPVNSVVSVTPTNGLDPDGDSVTVTGAGFATTGPGIYVGIASISKFSPTSMDAFGPTKWVHLGATPAPGQDVLNPDGSFSTTLDIDATFGSGASATDCMTEACAIFTFAAHGSTDRSQDTTTPLAFEGAVISTPTPTTTAPAPGPTAGAALGTLTPGSTQTVTGTGFTPGEIVQATLHSDPIDLGTFTADSDGTVVVQFAVPVDLAVGAHDVTLIGLTSAGQAVAAFTVAALAASATPTPLTSGTLALTGSSIGPLTLVGGLAVLGGAALMMLSLGRGRRLLPVLGRHV